ncbi:MAG: hypothetical protein K9J13_04145, partial [Saprospiraceae bacterium]|nr:hypothetical protein [Saprospiraceae bacterium]
MKRAFILFWIFVLGFSLSFAQKSGKPLRVEIEANHFSDQYYIVPIADNGVMLFSKSDQYTKDKDIWIFTKYNTQFKEEWTKKYPIENGYDYKEFYYNDDMLYVFFNDNYQGETKIEIVKINLKDEDIKDVSTSFKPKSNLSYYKVLHDNIFVAGSTMPTTMESCGQMCLTYTCLPILFGLTTYKIKPVVVNVDLSSKKKKILSPVLKGNSYVISVNANQDANTMNVVLKCDNNSNAFNKSEGFTMVYEYDDKGELNSSLKLKSKSSNDLLDGKIMQVDEKEKIFIGTYSKLNGKKKMGSGYADGMCFSKIVDNQQDFIKYYDFTDFDNFYASVSARFKKKIDRKKKRGKDVSVGFLLLVHDEIIVRNDEYIMIGEAYYPEYHTESYM